MRAQTEIAIREADLIFFMIDAKAGLTPDDRTFAEIVRRSGKPVVLVANKSEAQRRPGRLAGSLGARPRRAGRRSRPSTARACPTCATPSSRRSARSALSRDEEDDEDDPADQRRR